MTHPACLVAVAALLCGCGEARDFAEDSQPARRAAADDLRVRIDGDAVTVYAHHARIMDILEEIARQGGIALVLHDSIDDRATLEFERLAMREALRRLLHPRGFLLQSVDADHGKLWVFESGSAGDHAAPRTLSADAIEAENSIEDLSLALNDEDSKVRLEAATALSIIGGDRAVASLAAAALSDGDPSVREEAIHALGEIGGEKSIPVLQQALIDPDIDVREAAVDAFADVGGDESALALSIALNDTDTSVRIEAVDALGELGGRTAMQLLRQASTDERSVVREAAAELLAELSGRAPRPTSD